MRSAGMRHSVLSKSNSDRSACRSSPGRTNTNGARRRAQCATNVPSYPSMARSSPPIYVGSVVLAKCPLVAGREVRRAGRRPGPRRLSRSRPHTGRLVRSSEVPLGDRFEGGGAAGTTSVLAVIVYDARPYGGGAPSPGR
jgi:hypothetical protein